MPGLFEPISTQDVPLEDLRDVVAVVLAHFKLRLEKAERIYPSADRDEYHVVEVSSEQD